MENLLPLTDIEIRLLGCLIEKQHTTPNQYPLTLNSLQLAANQKTSRNPIMHLEAGEIGAALNDLQEKELVTKAPFTARADKYEQKFDRKLGLTEARTAILCVLMLRGDQTAAEIKAHAQRLYAFADVAAVKAQLEGLLLHEDKPLIIELPKKPGAKEVRYMHLLAGDIDMDEYISTPVTTTVKNQPLEALQARVEALENRLAKLEAQWGMKESDEGTE